MDNLNQNLINLIASYKKTGQSDEVIKQSLWQLGMIPEMVESHLDYYNKHTAQINKDINIVKETKDMKLPLEKLHTQSKKTIAALEEMKSDNSLGFSASSAQQIIESALAQLQITKDDETVMEEKIKAKLDELRIGLQADGGDLELVKIDGKVVYLKLVGHCGSCPFAMMTLKQGIEAGLQEIDPEITVERVEG